jgi:hypothetical protein
MSVPTLEEIIQHDIQTTAVRQLYLESHPVNLSEWFWFLKSLRGAWTPGSFVNCMERMGLKRKYARGICRIVVRWITTGYYPSAHARFTLDE